MVVPTQDIFSIDAVLQLMRFQWHSFGQFIFVREMGCQLLLITAWQIVAVADAQAVRPLLDHLSSAEKAAMLICCVISSATMPSSVKCSQWHAWNLASIVSLVVAAYILRSNGIVTATMICLLITLTSHALVSLAWHYLLWNSFAANASVAWICS